MPVTYEQVEDAVGQVTSIFDEATYELTRFYERDGAPPCGVTVLFTVEHVDRVGTIQVATRVVNVSFASIVLPDLEPRFLFLLREMFNVMGVQPDELSPFPDFPPLDAGDPPDDAVPMPPPGWQHDAAQNFRASAETAQFPLVGMPDPEPGRTMWERLEGDE